MHYAQQETKPVDRNVKEDKYFNSKLDRLVPHKNTGHITMVTDKKHTIQHCVVTVSARRVVMQRHVTIKSYNDIKFKNLQTNICEV